MMLRRSLLRLCAALLLLLPATTRHSAADTVLDSLRAGNTGRMPVFYQSVTQSDRPSGAAIAIPSTTMQLYTGCRLTDIYVYVYETGDGSPFRVFLSHEPGGEPICQQTFTPEAFKWNRVTLTEPYVPDGSAVCIGYEGTGLTLLPCMEAAEDGEEWFEDAGTWQRLGQPYGTALYAVMRGNLPHDNVRLTEWQLPRFAQNGGTVSVGGRFINLGAAPVGSITVETTFGTATTRQTIDGLDAGYREEAPFNLDIPVPGGEDRRSCSLRIVEVNGNADADPSDNASATADVLCADRFEARQVLLEVLSTERCSNCPTAHAYIERALRGRTGIVEVGHHIGYYTDSYTLDESREYEWFYADRMFAPALMFDRTNHAARFPAYAETATPVTGVGMDILNDLLDEESTAPAFVSLDLTGRLDAATRRLDLHVEGRALLPTDGMQPALTVLLTEDSLFTTTQSGASGGFYHRHTARRFLTPAWGSSVDTTDGFEADFQTEIPADWRIDRMQAVAFVANNDRSDRNNCAVLNTAALDLDELLSTGIGSPAEAGPLVRREGNVLIIARNCESLTLTAADGRTVLKRSNLTGGAFPLGPLPEGVYVLNAVSGHTMQTLKMLIGR